MIIESPDLTEAMPEKRVSDGKGGEQPDGEPRMVRR